MSFFMFINKNIVYLYEQDKGKTVTCINPCHADLINMLKVACDKSRVT